MDTFSTWLPISKSEVETEHGAPLRILHGIGSSDVWDQQREKIMQDSVDLSPFLTKGYINWNHLPGPANLIGEPLDARIVSGDELQAVLAHSSLPRKVTGAGLYIKAGLYDNQRANEVWELAQAIEKARKQGFSRRQIGWSVEGHAVRRNGPVISGFVCRGVACTHEPVNQETWGEVAKAMLFVAPKDGETEAAHYAFETFEELVKSMSTISTEPVRLQNLAGVSNTNLRTVENALYGQCKSSGSCYNNDGTCHRGKAGFFYHMVNCKGSTPQEAREFLTKLSKSLKS